MVDTLNLGLKALLMSDEKYEYLLEASAGWTKATLHILDGGAVQCDFQWSAIGNQGYHYRLYGKQKKISDTYGWISIYQVEDVLRSPTVSLPIHALCTELIYEYVKLSRSPFLQHPGDMLWVAARWHEFFDLILFTSSFVCGCLESLKYVIAEGTLEETYPEEERTYINNEFVEHCTNLTLGLDKMKFTRVMEPV
jgi:hypothetical protein